MRASEARYKSLHPAWLMGHWGQLWVSSIGSILSDTEVACKDSVKVRLPSYSPEDALLYLGGERSIYHFFGEDLVAYSERVRKAWDTWQHAGTTYGVLKAVDATGLVRDVPDWDIETIGWGTHKPIQDGLSYWIMEASKLLNPFSEPPPIFVGVPDPQPVYGPEINPDFDWLANGITYHSTSMYHFWDLMKQCPSFEHNYYNAGLHWDEPGVFDFGTSIPDYAAAVLRSQILFWSGAHTLTPWVRVIHQPGGFGLLWGSHWEIDVETHQYDAPGLTYPLDEHVTSDISVSEYGSLGLMYPSE